MPLPERVAAVPAYILSSSLRDAAPGHRFLMYLENWQGAKGDAFAPFKKSRPQGAVERATHGQQCAGVLNDLCALPPSSLSMLKGILSRQRGLMAQLDSAAGLSLSAIGSAPFATGLGNAHPIENGFAFLSPYGLPYLAGSGVKGIVRRAMQELMAEAAPGFTCAHVDALMGPKNTVDARRGALDFWDVFPTPNGGRLVVEIMTPHFSDYYQGKGSPNDSGAPSPVVFLALPAKSQFEFHVVCRPERLPDELSDQWQAMVTQAFHHAFAWVGFGAKTSVGYGAMTPTSTLAPKGVGAALGIGNSEARSVATTVWPTAEIVLNPGTGEIKAIFEGKTTAGLRAHQATAFRAGLSAEQEKKLAKSKALKNVEVHVEQIGNGWLLVNLVRR